MKKMKETEIDWIGEIPHDWELKHFKYIVKEKVDNRGRTPEINENNVGIPIIELDAIGEKIPEVKKASKFISDKSYKKYIRKDLKSGDVLFGTVGSVGKCSIVPEKFDYCIAQNIVGYRFDNHQNSLFWFYYFKSEPFYQMYMQFNKGNIQDSIKISDMERGIVVVPPLKEQELIADFLDNKVEKIDDILNNLNKQVEILKKYKKSLITEIVTKGLNPAAKMKDSGINWIGKIPENWEIKKLKYLGTARNGLTYSPESQVDEGTLVMRSSNIQDGKLIFEDNVYVDMRIPENIILRENDLLICSRNGSRNLIGKNALISKDYVGQTYGAFMCVYRSKYNEFIHYVLNSDIFSYYLGSFLTSTINQLTNDNLYSIETPFPLDEKERREIVEFLDKKSTQIDEIIKDKQNQIDKMEKYKKSLIYEYVTGKKRVKGAEELYV